MTESPQLLSKLPDGYSFPAEYDIHAGTILVWPVRPGSFPFECRDAKVTFVEIIAAITTMEPVYLICDAEHTEEAGNMIRKKGIRTVNHHISDLGCPSAPYPVYFQIYTSDDAWARDTAPTFVRNQNYDIIGIDWVFNAWGGKIDGLLPFWNRDDDLAGLVCKCVTADRYSLHESDSIHPGFVLEGGSIHTDGQGTLITTEACLLSKGRNPDLTKNEIENILKKLLGIRKVIWLPHGIYGDETNEHVDNVCAFTRPCRVVLAWTDDKNDPQYRYSMEDLEVLEHETDALGRKFEIVKLPIPSKPVTVTAEDLQGYSFEPGEDEREAGERLAASYVNFYICNGTVLVPQFGDSNDKTAVSILTDEFQTRKVIPIMSRSILLGGGNIHCVTAQIPEHRYL